MINPRTYFDPMQLLTN